MDKELKRGALEMLLLKLIAEQPRYGYEIVTILEQRVARLQLRESTLYPVLYRLENDGFIAGQWETFERGVPRKVYKLTPNGFVEFERLINEWREFSGTINRFLSIKG